MYHRLKSFVAFLKFLTCLPISRPFGNITYPYLLVEEIIFVRETNLACKCFVDIKRNTYAVNAYVLSEL